MPVTITFIGLIGLVYLAFGINVGVVRARTKTLLGPGDDPRLMRAIRAHGNLAEWAPVAILLIGGMEYVGASETLLISLAGAYVFARVCHGIGLVREYGNPHPLRAVGAFINIVVVSWGSVYLLSSSGLF